MMNREIKFRAWDGKRMTTSGIMFNTSTGCLEVPIEASFSGKLTVAYSLMQYTGLKDSKGVDIFEGDVVELFGQVADIRYSTLWGGYIAWCEKMKDNQDQPLCDGYNSLAKDCTIIGNIHQNPDLTK